MTGPLRGVRAVEVALGVSAVGAGLAASLPGTIFRDLGAEVTRVQSRRQPELDRGTELHRPWNRGKRVIEVDDDTDPGQAAAAIAGEAQDADVLFLAGPEDRLERHGVTYAGLARRDPRLIVARVRPSRTALGEIPDLELLVHARAGLLTQFAAHRDGPAFCDVPVGAAGAGLIAAAAALACLYERESTGRGGWAETSLLDGMQALLPMIIGRPEHHSPATSLNWDSLGPAESLCYRCADGEYVQLWFGAKGAYEAFLAHIGDPPSERGYQHDLRTAAMAERGRRWAQAFAAHDRAWWLKDLAGQKFRCEPVLRPGEALADSHVRETGLSIACQDPDLGEVTVLGPAIQVTQATPATPAQAPPGPPARLLAGVRVLDFSAYLAGPVATHVLAELGADVVKVEPATGDAHRVVEPLFAAGQRGKRAVALDLKSPGAPAVLERLFRWADVVHHNSRVGLAEQLGYDEATVRAAAPGVVYSFASGFGESGSRARLPANDQLMQALAGIEAGQGGAGQPPTYLSWGAVDVTGGWMAACGILAALYARRRGGGGQKVASSLLGAALTLKSGAFLAAGRETAHQVRASQGGAPQGGAPQGGAPQVDAHQVHPGPVLDAGQTGYGPAYRLYQTGDSGWLALAVPDQGAWDRLRDLPGLARLTPLLPSLLTDPATSRTAQATLEAALGSRPAADWAADLRAASIPVEPVTEASRAQFAAGLLDDPVCRQLGQVVSYQWGDRGRVDQLRVPLRLGPEPAPRAAPGLPGLGEHTAEVLQALGLDDAERAALAESGTIPPVELKHSFWAI